MDYRSLYLASTSDYDTRMSDEYDSPWKVVLERYFQDFMVFFFPNCHDDIDWSRGYESLDTELQKIVRDAETGKRLADKLIKVWRLDGEEQHVLIHVEVQGNYDSSMAERMFIYHYRLLDAYQKPIVSLAVLGDDNPNWRPSCYQKQLWGCKVAFDFPIVKLLDYQAQSEALIAHKNPFAWIVLTHLKTGATRGHPEARLQWKFQRVKQLYEKGYERTDILELFRFLDWLLALPKALEQRFQKQFIEYEATMSQPYISNIERRWQQEAQETVRVATEKVRVATEKATEKATKKATKKATEKARIATEKATEEARKKAKEENLIAQRKLLRRLTHRRFGEYAAEQLSGQYEQISDTDQLSDVAEWIIDCETAENLQVRIEGII